MRFDFAVAVNIAQLAGSVVGVAQSQPCAAPTSQFLTANYITHGLPQQCAPTARRQSSYGSDSIATSIPAGSDAPQSTDPVVVAIPQNSTLDSVKPEATSSIAKETPSAVEDSDSPLDPDQFLSFDQWRARKLAEVGQSAKDFEQRAPREPRKRPGASNDLDSLGEDAEIEFNFGYDGDTTERSLQQKNTKAPKSGTPTKHGRSKMAGKTGKERFNYASFDCAATVHKTNREVKGATSILVEHKDSYMLNECRAKDKFVIVELCDDILVDTIVLANYEFFSSMFRQFRVSVSDRYPVKASGWKELGVFEGRNSREVQAFLVENPLIWARYLKIDFLTHYGNEYYCPISLLRVHGTTMLEEFRADKEALREQQDDDVDDDVAEETALVIADTDVRNDPAVVAQEAVADVSSQKTSDTPTHTEAPVVGSEPSVAIQRSDDRDSPMIATALNPPQPTSHPVCEFKNTTGLIPNPSTCAATYRIATTAASSTPSTQPIRLPATASGTQQTQGTDIVPTLPNKTQAQDTVGKAQDGAQSAKSSPTQSAPHHPSPTTQESFYKTVYKRLGLLEANATLSLQYIEDQSRNLREAFAKVEKRQTQKQNTFMEALNTTLRAELSAYVS